MFYKFSIGFQMRWRFGLGRFVLLSVKVALHRKTGRKLEAPPGRKLVENWRTEIGRKLEFSLTKKKRKTTAPQFGGPTNGAEHFDPWAKQKLLNEFCALL